MKSARFTRNRVRFVVAENGVRAYDREYWNGHSFEYAIYDKKRMKKLISKHSEDILAAAKKAKIKNFVLA